MVHFVGAGPGAPDLITLRGAERLKEADVVIYAGSLVNPVLLGLCSAQCRIFNSAEMTLEQVLSTMEQAEREQKQTVRLHTGDPCLYGAIQEQMDALKKRGIPYTLTPGVSSFCGAAAAVEGEYTLPGISQTVIITRMAGRTPVPERENIASLAEHGATMVIFLSASLLDGLQEALLQGAYTQQTPAALVYKATWPEEKVVRCPLGELLSTMEQAEREQKQTVRLHTGDPCLYGAIQEQMDALKKRGIPYTLTPGVSSFCGAAAAVEGEYTLPGISQTVIITRMAGRTPVPERENIASLAEHGATMVIFLSASLLDGLQEALLQGAYTQQTPAALVYKATWPEEKVVRCPLGELAQAGRDHGISKTALVLVGDFLSGDYTRSRLYAPDFSTEFRRASE